MKLQVGAGCLAAVAAFYLLDGDVRSPADARTVLYAYATATENDTARVRLFCQNIEERLAADLQGNVFAEGLVEKCGALGYLSPGGRGMPKAAGTNPAAWPQG